ncbi:MAG: hypothetical protein LBQ56_02120 [Synergistaceae bacterium]|nr:hypothetical protein [Synergistaceae bacterium]
MTVWTSRRPIATVWISLNMFLTGENLRYAMAAMTIFNSIAIVVSVRCVQRHLGGAPAWLANVLLFFYYRTFLGLALSEQVGFFFGCMAFPLLWNAASGGRQPRVSFFAGLLMLTIGLVARAGTFFVLPLLMLWYSFRLGLRRSSVKILLASVCVVLLVFGYNRALLKTFGNPEAAFGNFAPTLYGLLHGGTWTQPYEDYPELLELPEIESNSRIYAMSVARLREAPMSLVKGALRAYASFFISPLGAYSFVVSPLALSLEFHDFAVAQKSGASEVVREFLGSDPVQIYYASSAFLWFLLSSFLALAGVIRLIMTRSSHKWFLISAGIGILLSVPFLPPWDAPLMRVYAASMPFFAILPCMALRPSGGGDSGEETGRGYGLEFFSVAVCAVMIAFPLFMRLNQDRIRENIPSPAGQGSEVVKIIPGSVASPGDGRVLEKFFDDVDFIAEALKNERIKEFKDAEGSFALGVAYFPGTGSTRYAYWDAGADMPLGEWVLVEKVSDEENARMIRKLNLHPQ